MKHSKYVHAAVVGLFACGLAVARVEAEYVEPHERTTENSVWANEDSEWNQPTEYRQVTPAPLQAPAPVATAPTALAPVAPALPLEAPAPSSLAYGPVTETSGTTHLEAKVAPEAKASSLRITPMVGKGDYIGLASITNRNRYSLGLGLEFLNDSLVALELEGGLTNNWIAYGGPGIAIAHAYDVFSLGGNAKFYLSRGTIRPYLGAGMAAVYYSGMQQPTPMGLRQFDQLIGAGQLIAGADVALSQQVGIGLRGSFVQPLLNLPMVPMGTPFASPEFAEAGLTRTAYYRILGTLSIDM